MKKESKEPILEVLDIEPPNLENEIERLLADKGVETIRCPACNKVWPKLEIASLACTCGEVMYGEGFE